MANSQKVITGEVRLSYAHVFTPAVTPSGEKKYSVSLLIPKSDADTVQKIKDAISICENALRQKLGIAPSAPVKNPLRDGDTERPQDPAYKGCYFLNANSSNPVPCIDTDFQPIVSPSDLYSGCYARASVNFYPYSQSGNRGTGVGLNAIQKLRDGENLSGSVVDAVAEFGGSPSSTLDTNDL